MSAQNIVIGAVLKPAIQAALTKLLDHSKEPTKLCVSFVGDGASVCMDARGQAMVQLPDIDNAARLTRGESEIITGFAIHELAHILHTDLRKQFPSDVLADITNGLEDARIEREIVKDGVMGGARTLFGRLHHHHLEQCKEINLLDLNNAAYWLACACREATQNYGNKAFNSALEALRKDTRAEAVLMCEVFDVAIEGLAKIGGGKMYFDGVVLLAREILKMLKQLGEPEAQPKPSQQGQQGEQGEGDTGDESDTGGSGGSDTDAGSGDQAGGKSGKKSEADGSDSDAQGDDGGEDAGSAGKGGSGASLKGSLSTMRNPEHSIKSLIDAMRERNKRLHITPEGTGIQAATAHVSLA
jgi:hypothetical protein